MSEGCNVAIDPNAVGEVNIEIQMKVGDIVQKHVIRGYELVAIQKDPNTDQIAFVVKEPLIGKTSWNLIQAHKWGIEYFEQQPISGE